MPSSLGIPLTALACSPTLLPLGADGAHVFPTLEGGETIGEAGGGAAAEEEEGTGVDDQPLLGEVMAEAAAAAEKAMAEGEPLSTQR